MTTQPEALHLADGLDAEFVQGRISNHTGRKAAAELRRLNQSEREGWRYAKELEARITTLEAALRQALEALTVYDGTNGASQRKRVLAALRERLDFLNAKRLAQPECVQLTVRDFVVTVGGIEDAVGTPTYWAEWPNKEQA